MYSIRFPKLVYSSFRVTCLMLWRWESISAGVSASSSVNDVCSSSVRGSWDDQVVIFRAQLEVGLRSVNMEATASSTSTSAASVA